MPFEDGVKGLACFVIEVIGGLVEHQQIGLPEQTAGEGHAHGLTAAETLDGKLEVPAAERGETEAAEQCQGTLGHVPPAAHPLEEGLVAGAGLDGGDRLEPRGDAEGLRQGRASGLRPLGQPGHGAGPAHRARAGLQLTHEQAYQSGLADAVGTHEGRLFAPQGEAHAIEHPAALRCVPHQILTGEHLGRDAEGGAVDRFSVHTILRSRGETGGARTVGSNLAASPSWRSRTRQDRTAPDSGNSSDLVLAPRREPRGVPRAPAACCVAAEVAERRQLGLGGS